MKTTKKSKQKVSTRGLPMVQVRMTNDGPRLKKTAEELDAEIAEALTGHRPKRTVTIVTITERFRQSSERTREQMLVYASHEAAVDEMGSHLTDPEADATISIRTMDVIQ